MLEKLHPYLGDIEKMTAEVTVGKNSYIHPALKNLGCVSLVLVREIVAPAVFRGLDEEITALRVDGENVVRAIPNKFKHKERQRGLQILRHYGFGGRFAQNKTIMNPGDKPSDAFDLNSLVFGDSANHGSRVLPVKAAALYSDALSIRDYVDAVDSTFHNVASEDGTLFDAESKKNSVNLFERHFVRPGTLLVQNISLQGKLMPVEGLVHLLLSIGSSGTYGGQTSVTGTNVRTHIAGIFASKIERAECAPTQLVRALREDGLGGAGANRLGEVREAIMKRLDPLHEATMNSEECDALLQDLEGQVSSDEPLLRMSYGLAADKVGDLFDSWFGDVKPKKQAA